jgi:phenylacetate-CoA ligase
MIVTDLHKTSLPILRYELNDLLTLDPEPCPCGSAFRVVAQIQGRRDDLFWSPTLAGGARWIFPDYLRRAIIAASDAVHAYQAVQTAADAVTVHLQLEPAADAAAADAVRAAVGDAVRRVFADHGCPPPRVHVDLEAPRPHPDSLKLVRIRRAFDVPPGGPP